MTASRSTQSEPIAQVVRFSPRRGLSYRSEKDHLAADGAGVTLCGCAINPLGYETLDNFDAKASYSCKRCVAAVRKRGPFVVYWRTSWHHDKAHRTVVSA